MLTNMKRVLLLSLLIAIGLSACSAQPGKQGSPDAVLDAGGQQTASGTAVVPDAEAGERGFFGGLFYRLFGWPQAKPDLVQPVRDVATTSTQEVAAGIVRAVREKPAAIKLDAKAELEICGLGRSCSGDMGSVNWLKEAWISAKSYQRALRFSADSKLADGGILEISRVSLAGEWPAKTIYSAPLALGETVFDFSTLFVAKSESLEKSTEAVKDASSTVPDLSKKIDASKLIKPAKPVPLAPLKISLKKEIEFDALKLASLQPTYFLRVVPTKGGQLAGKASNEIKVKMVAPQDQTEIKLYSPLKIYDVEIESFQPVRAPQSGVCSNAMILDTPGLVPVVGGIGFEQKQAGDRICPAPYRGVGEKAWYEYLWDSITSGVSWISEAYNDLKSAVVSAVGSVACGGDDTCEKALSAGLDMGLVALGIPPTLPNFDQLVDGGFDYLAGELSVAAGCPDAVCREAIKKGLKEALDQKKNPNPGCMDAAVAHDMGMEPLCLPDGMRAHFDPAAMHRGAEVVLTVRRNSTPVPDEKLIASSAYRLLISFPARNEKAIGHKIINIEPYNRSVTIEKALEGSLFGMKVLDIPYLEPGGSMDIPVQLTPVEYWAPGHKEAMEGWTTVVYKDGWPQYQYDDWWLFYYGAELNVIAQIDGCKYQGGNECIISTDGLKMEMPMTINN